MHGSGLNRKVRLFLLFLRLKFNFYQRIIKMRIAECFAVLWRGASFRKVVINMDHNLRGEV